MESNARKGIIDCVVWFALTYTHTNKKNAPAFKVTRIDLQKAFD